MFNLSKTFEILAFRLVYVQIRNLTVEFPQNPDLKYVSHDNEASFFAVRRCQKSVHISLVNVEMNET